MDGLWRQQIQSNQQIDRSRSQLSLMMHERRKRRQAVASVNHSEAGECESRAIIELLAVYS